VPSGRLGKAALVGGNNTTIYTTPAGAIASATVSLCNRGEADARVRLAVSTAAVPAADDYLEYDAIVPGNGVLERTGVVCSEGEQIIVRSTTSNVTARAHGFEEVA